MTVSVDGVSISPERAAQRTAPAARSSTCGARPAAGASAPASVADTADAARVAAGAGRDKAGSAAAETVTLVVTLVAPGTDSPARDASAPISSAAKLVLTFVIS